MSIEEFRDLKIGDKVKTNEDLYVKNTLLRSIKKGFVSPVFLLDKLTGRVGILGAIVDYSVIDKVDN